MRNQLFSLTAAVALATLTAGCAASTYALNPSTASGLVLSDPAGAATPPGSKSPGAGEHTVLSQEGDCSWYGPRFHGRRTSNGESFDQNALTAAHPSLPFGTQVEVTALDTGNKVQVRINDRGPFVRRRIIDLSHAAAHSLGIVGRGVAKVALRLIDAENAAWPAQTYALQVASFASAAQAENFVAALTPAQKAAAVYYVRKPDPDARGYRVRFGPFEREEMAKVVAARLKLVGLGCDVVTENFGQASIVVQNTPAAPASGGGATLR